MYGQLNNLAIAPKANQLQNMKCGTAKDWIAAILTLGLSNVICENRPDLMVMII